MMWAVVWQFALLVAVATLIAWLLRRSSPVVRYWLWQIVAIKLLLMPFWTFAIPLPSWAESRPLEPPAAVQPAENLGDNSDRPALPTSASVGGRPGRGGRAARRAVLGTAFRDWLASVASAGVVRRGALADRSAVESTSAAGRFAQASGSRRRRACRTGGGLGRTDRTSPRAGGRVGGRRLPAVCLRALAVAARVAQPADGLAGTGRAAAGHFARVGAREAARSGVGMARRDRADRLLLPSAGLLGGLSTSAGAGVGLRPTGDGPQRPPAGRLRPNAGSSRQSRLGAGGRASRRHLRRPDGQRTVAETTIDNQTVPERSNRHGKRNTVPGQRRSMRAAIRN